MGVLTGMTVIRFLFTSVFPNLDSGLRLMINTVVMEHGARKKAESTVN